jgi:antitoxin component YwqK of YwqJK toxin-antitoxin module
MFFNRQFVVDTNLKSRNRMTFSKLVMPIFLIIFAKNYSQEKFIVKYQNGKTKIESYIKDNTLDSIYKEFYENGNLKVEGFYKDCVYKTNRKKIYMAGCSVRKDIDTIKTGKRHGTWKNYYENGILSYIANFHCNIQQGNFYSYNKEEKLETIEFYFEGKLMYSQEFNDNGILIETSNFKYENGSPSSFRKVHTFQFYQNGDLKSENLVNYDNTTEIEDYKEYYPSGFLKLNKYTVNGNKNKVYKEFFENGNVKYEGFFKNDYPIKKQYFYNENGTIMKIETWKKQKLIKTETK